MRLNSSIRETLLISTLAIAVASGCKKDPIIEELHQNKIIEGNEAPPYSGVSTLQIENYVNKLYIDLVGREPNDAELDADVAVLKSDDLGEAARIQLIDKLQSQYAYYKRYSESTGARLLNGIDSAETNETLVLYLALIQMAYQQGDTLLAYLLEYQYDQFDKLHVATSEYASGAIDINEYFKRYILNPFYDEINMGSQNFVLACFENLFFRFPTASELTEGVKMVDGTSTQMFLEDGNSKQDFVDIVTCTTEFYEGLVIEAYRSLLSRDPTSYEMDSLTQALEQSSNLKAMQKQVLKSQEYAGF